MQLEGERYEHEKPNAAESKKFKVVFGMSRQYLGKKRLM